MSMENLSRLAAPSRFGRVELLLALGGAAFAIAVGLAAGHPTAATLGPPVLVIALVGVVTALLQPFAAYLVVAGSTAFLVIYNLPGNRGLNFFDLLLPPLLVASVLGTARDRARAADHAVTDPARLEILAATRRLVVAVLVFYAICWLSLMGALHAGRVTTVVDGTLSLMRVLQAMLLFPLGLWWFRSERRIHHLFRGIIVSVVISAIVNVIAIAFFGVKRAGLAWFVNEPVDIIGGPNAIGTTMMFLGVLLLVRQTLEPRLRNVALFGLVLAMLVLSATRSGLLACTVVAALLLPRARWGWVFVGLLMVAVAIPLAPEQYWTRLAHTITLKRGTVETYTTLIRFYSWKVALSVFLAHPILGVGYLGFTNVSGDFGPLRLIGGPAENYLLETASGTGILGVVGFLVALVRLFQLGRVVRRHAPPGSLAAVMARHHVPLLIGYLVVSLTGDTFCGMENVGQLALWSAMLVRSGLMALENAPVIGSTRPI